MRSSMILLGICLFVVLSNATVTPVNQTEFYGQWVKSINFEVETGYVQVDSLNNDTSSNNYFYHLVYKQGTNSGSVSQNDPLILWLNGGPGCASQFGLFGEIGPFDVQYNDTNKTFTVDVRPATWNKQSIQLFVDQPFGAGLSWSNSSYFVNNTTTAAEYFAEFLSEFFTSHPSLLKNPFYLFGESFAGHYIPAIATQIFTNPKLKDLGINYQGVGIGDGWTVPFQQVAYYGSYLYSAGLVDNLRRDYTLDISTKAQQSILNNDFSAGQKYFDQASGDVLANFTGNISPYNFQQYLPTDEQDELQDPYARFLNQYKDQFGVPSFVNYGECNETIYEAFGADIATSREPDVVFLLSKGKVLLYNGQLDYIVNTPGALMWINQMKWDKISQWKKSDKQIFKVNNQTAGSVKAFDNLTFVVIYGAGHMVPSDQPEAASAMLQHFLNGDQKWE